MLAKKNTAEKLFYVGLERMKRPYKKYEKRTFLDTNNKKKVLDRHKSIVGIVIEISEAGQCQKM